MRTEQVKKNEKSEKCAHWMYMQEIKVRSESDSLIQSRLILFSSHSSSSLLLIFYFLFLLLLFSFFFSSSSIHLILQVAACPQPPF